MKTHFLFLQKFRKIGFLLFLLGISFNAIFVVFGDQISEYEITQLNRGNVIPLNTITNDANLLLLLSGLLLIGFTEEKIEDEQIAKLRLDSLKWAMYYALMFICVVAINGMSFFAVMAYNIFSPLAFFIVRFRWKIYQLNTLLAKEDAMLS
ncbi:MAG: hypothetical protein ACOH2A_01240 [Sphingobacteriaceae bacterium]